MAGGISWKTPRRIVVFGSLGVVIALVLAVTAMTYDVWREESMPVKGSATVAATRDELAVVSRTKVFFGHQSVGENVLGGVAGVYAENGVAAPPIEQGGTEPGPEGGFIAHEFIGENERPLTKIEDFDELMRNGMGEKVDVALMKLCYIDFTSTTDIHALFARYRDTMAGLERDYPNVTFVHTTVPLTTEPGGLAKLKTRLGGSDRFGQAENLVREQYNRLIRNEYGDRHLFDVAAAESTGPDGTRDSRTYDGQQYFTLDAAYASDLGHLNQAGAQVAATALLHAIAQASPK
jgi:hypothetical protein